MPFPQFLDYNNGAYKTLATQWPDGVSHAEMEKVIRDAYQIMMNRADYAGGNIRGVPGIIFNSSPQCSEGNGYALLAAALMGDKATFDGLWFYLNDNCWFNGVPRYSNGAVCAGAYPYGYHAPGWLGGGTDAATDGDVDIALAALIAWNQWGDNTGYTKWNGTPIQYREMALDMMRFLVVKAEGTLTGDGRWTSGDIGYDGYFKGGNTWGEITNWAVSGGYPVGDRPEFQGPQANSWFDYGAAGYFRCFGETLQGVGDPVWNYTQFQKATESTNWLFGQLAANPAYKVITAGQYSVNGTTATFATANPGGEDFRAPLRNIMDYLWNGNPTQSWNPATHQVVAGGNTYMYNAAMKQANFLKDPQATGLACANYGSSPITYRGIAALREYNLDGSEFWTFHLNRFGASAPAIVASQDLDLMGQFFRELMIEWDVQTPGDNYLTSVPAYFHGFFRVIGLLTLTGNWQNACDIAATANMKIYKAINKTYAFPGDNITCWINYRNYGSLDAAGVKIIDTLPSAFTFVSSTPAGTYNAVNNTVTWNIGNVTGMRNQNYNASMGGVTLVVRVRDNALQGRYCNFADISCTNGTGFTSSEFPNEVSTIMKRNCVDIVAAALTITKTASASIVGVGDIVTYTIDFCNSSQAGWINGGRSGVNWAAGVNPLQTNSSEYKLDFAAHHEAAEPVIDWSNYRVSYFVNSALHGTQWGIAKNSSSPFDANITMSTEDFLACMPVACTDVTGKSWNQRLILNFNSMPSAPTHHLYNYYGMMSRIHLGTVQAPFYFEIRLFDSTYMTPQNWTDDWSQLTTAHNVSGPDRMMFPINPDWTKGDGTSVTTNRVNKHACQTTATSITNILVEEWDGYTWRRVFGNGPMPGREVNSVHVIDSLPQYIAWGGLVSMPAGATFTYSPATKSLDFNIGNMQINQCGQIKYWTTVANPGCPRADLPQVNTAWVYGATEAPVADATTVIIRCGVVPTSTFTASRTSTASPTPSPTSTNTLTPTYTSTATSSFTRTPTPSPSPTFTRTATPSPSPTPTFTRTASPTFSSTQSPTPTYTGTQTPTFTRTVTVTSTRTVTSTVTITFMDTMTVTPTITMTSTPTSTNTRTVTSSYTNTNSPTPTYTNTSTPTFSRTVTVTLTRTSTPTITITFLDTMTITPTVTQTFTASPTFTRTSTATNTRTDTATPSVTITSLNTQTVTYTRTETFTRTPTPTSTDTPTYTFTRTATNSYTSTPTITITFLDTMTITPTITPTFTVTATPTHTRTRTDTPTFTSTRTPTATYTETLTITETSYNTATASPTITPTATSTRTPTPTSTFTDTATHTRTVTDSPTFTETRTPTNTRTYTNTTTPSRTLTLTLTVTNSPTATDTPTPTYTVTDTYTATSSPTITPTPSETTTALPAPVDITISLSSEGPLKPKIGDHVTFTITLKNNTDRPLSNISVWDSLPAQVLFIDTSFTDAPLIQDGQYIAWDISYKDGDPFILMPGQSETISFEIEIISATITKQPIVTVAQSDYSDGYYFPGGPNGDKHPPVTTDAFFYPIDRMVVFPNPFDPAKDGTIKFDNMVPGSVIQIWTLSGELVKNIDSGLIRAYWDGKNWKGYEVSAGIYLFTVKNGTDAKPLKGKIFVIKE
jgi:uncharacterized repeat protein (TIGR01451 family)